MIVKIAITNVIKLETVTPYGENKAIITKATTTYSNAINILRAISDFRSNNRYINIPGLYKKLRK